MAETPSKRIKEAITRKTKQNFQIARKLNLFSVKFPVIIYCITTMFGQSQKCFISTLNYSDIVSLILILWPKVRMVLSCLKFNLKIYYVLRIIILCKVYDVLICTRTPQSRFCLDCFHDVVWTIIDLKIKLAHNECLFLFVQPTVIYCY